MTLRLEEQMEMEAVVAADTAHMAQRQAPPPQSFDLPRISANDQFSVANSSHKSRDEKENMVNFQTTVQAESTQPIESAGEQVFSRSRVSIASDDWASLDVDALPSLKKERKPKPSPAPPGLRALAEAARDGSLDQIMAELRRPDHQDDKAGTATSASSACLSSVPHLEAAGVSASGALWAFAEEVASAEQAQEEARKRRDQVQEDDGMQLQKEYLRQGDEVGTTAAATSLVRAAPEASQAVEEITVDEDVMANGDMSSGASRWSIMRQRGLEARKAALAAVAAATTSSVSVEPEAEEDSGVEEDVAVDDMFDVVEEEKEQTTRLASDTSPCVGKLSEWRPSRKTPRWHSSLSPHEQVPVDPTLWKAWIRELLEEQLARGSWSACTSPISRLTEPATPPLRRSRPSSAPAGRPSSAPTVRPSSALTSGRPASASTGRQTLASSLSSSPVKTPAMQTQTPTSEVSSAKSAGSLRKTIARQSPPRSRPSSGTSRSPIKRRGVRPSRPQSAPRLLDGNGLLEKRAHRVPFLQHIEDKEVQRSISKLRHESIVEKELVQDLDVIHDTYLQDLKVNHNAGERAKTESSRRRGGQKSSQGLHHGLHVHRIGPTHQAWKQLRPVEQMRNLCHVMEVDAKLTKNRWNTVHRQTAAIGPKMLRKTRGAAAANEAIPGKTSSNARTSEIGGSMGNLRTEVRRTTTGFSKSLAGAFNGLGNDDLGSKKRRASLIRNTRDNPELSRMTLKILEFILEKCGNVRAFFYLLTQRHGKVRRRDWETAFMALGHVSDEPHRLFRAMDPEGRHELPLDDLQEAVELAYGVLVQNRVELARRSRIIEAPLMQEMGSPAESAAKSPSTPSESGDSDSNFTPQASY